VRRYSYRIDYAIALSLHKYNTLTYNELKRTIESKEYLNRGLSRDTFSYHINKMLKGDYISTKKIESWKRGKKKFFVLDPSTEEQIQLNTLLISYEERDKTRQERTLQSYHKLKKREQIVEASSQLELRRKKIYYIIMRVMSIRKPNRYYKFHGVSVRDILKARYDGYAFYYLKLEDYRPLVEECITYLLKLNIIKQISSIPTHEEPRYEFVETIYKEFVNDVSERLENDIRLRLHLVWQNLRPPTPQDRIYFERCWGLKAANKNLNRVYNILQKKKRNLNHNSKNKKEEKDFIKILDCNIVDVMKDLKETYDDLIKKHPFMCKTIIDTIYPEYLQKDVEKIVLTSRYKKKNYPKALRAISKDTLTITSVGKAFLVPVGHKEVISKDTTARSDIK
jgi:hypothetical protein